MTKTATTTAPDLAALLERRLTGLWARLTREAQSDLSRTSAAVLATLRDLGPQRVTALATHEHVAQPTMTVLLQRLERRGLVTRETDPNDRRGCRVAITETGAALLRERAEARAAWLRPRLDRLDPAQRAALEAAITHLLTDDDQEIA